MVDESINHFFLRYLRIKFTFLFTCLSAVGIAQIQVHDEPLHHPVLQKEVARVLDVVAYPNDTSLVHQHSNNYCYVTIKGGTIWLESQGELGRTVELKTGFIGGYYDNPQHPLIHRFANRSAELIRLITVENLSSGNRADTLYHPKANEELVVSNAYFRVIRILIHPGEQKDITHSYPSVVVNINNDSLQSVTKKRVTELPTWIWLDPNKKISLNNSSSTEATVVLIQIKKSSY